MERSYKVLNRRLLPWLLCFVLLCASISLFYPQIASLHAGLLTRDHRTQHYPWACFLDSALSQGALPWWTWKIHCGFPLLAEGQIGGLYPPNLVLHLLFSANVAYSLSFLLHLVIAGMSFVLYCKHIKLSWPSVAIAALAFLYGNAFGGAYYNFTSLKTLCWFPLSLYLIDRLGDARWGKWGLFLGFVFGMQLLAGYLQLAVYGIGMSLLYFVLMRPPRKACLGLLIALAVTTLLYLPQFAATFPLSQMSGRVGLKESFAYLGSFPPWGIPTLILPRMQASPVPA